MRNSFPFNAELWGLIGGQNYIVNAMAVSLSFPSWDIFASERQKRAAFLSLLVRAPALLTTDNTDVGLLGFVCRKTGNLAEYWKEARQFFFSVCKSRSMLPCLTMRTQIVVGVYYLMFIGCELLEVARC